MSTNLDQVRAAVRVRLAGRTRIEITRAACTAKDNRDAAVDLLERHGDTFSASALEVTAAYEEHKRIWQSLKGQSLSAVYTPDAGQSAA